MSRAIKTPRLWGWLALAAGFGLAGCGDNPLGYMTGAAGPAAWQMQALGWGLLLISIAVVVIIAVMIGLAIRSGQRAAPVSQDVRRGRDGLRWIYWGVVLTFPVLVFMSVWTFIASRSVAEPEHEVGLTVTVEGEQWWWGITYEDEVPANVFRDANNLTIPTGVPVKVHLQSDNVIHGF